MFGYIKPSAPDLRVREYELYKAVYCGLCYSLGKKVTCTSRLSLSYDFAFLALVRMALVRESGTLIKKRCIAHIGKKRNVVVDSNELNITARLSALLTYYKIKDDIADSKGFKRFAVRFLLPSASRMKKKAKIDWECENYINERLSELSKLEKEGCDSLDRVSEPFGALMAKICAYGFEKGSPAQRIASEIGRHIGRFIYIIDAIDDYSEDIKSGSYNPFTYIYGSDILKFTKDTPLLKDALIMTLSSVADAVELIDFNDFGEFGEIIKNTIYIGLPALVDKVISRYNDKTNQNGEETNEQSI